MWGGAQQRYVCANHQKPPGKMRTALNFYKEVSTAMALCFPRTCGQCSFSLLHICKEEERKKKTKKVKLCLLRPEGASHTLWARRRWWGGRGGGDILQHRAPIRAAQRRREFWETEVFISTSRWKPWRVTRSQSRNK